MSPLLAVTSTTHNIHACVASKVTECLSCLGHLQEVKVLKGIRKGQRRMAVAPAGVSFELLQQADRNSYVAVIDLEFYKALGRYWMFVCSAYSSTIKFAHKTLQKAGKVGSLAALSTVAIIMDFISL